MRWSVAAELRAIKIGGPGQWRVEHEQIEAYIRRAYEETAAFVTAHPFTDTDDEARTDP